MSRRAADESDPHRLSAGRSSDHSGSSGVATCRAMRRASRTQPPSDATSPVRAQSLSTAATVWSRQALLRVARRSCSASTPVSPGWPHGIHRAPPADLRSRRSQFPVENASAEPAAAHTQRPVCVTAVLSISLTSQRTIAGKPGQIDVSRAALEQVGKRPLGLGNGESVELREALGRAAPLRAGARRSRKASAADACAARRCRAAHSGRRLRRRSVRSTQAGRRPDFPAGSVFRPEADDAGVDLGGGMMQPHRHPLSQSLWARRPARARSRRRDPSVRAAQDRARRRRGGWNSW